MMFKLVGWQKECSTFYKWMSVLCAPLCKKRIFHKKAMSAFFTELFVFFRGGRKDKYIYCRYVGEFKIKNCI